VRGAATSRTGIVNTIGLVPYFNMAYCTYHGGEPSFEWDAAKDRLNRVKHGVSFALAQRAFLDPKRVIAEDLRHSGTERRYYCFGRVGDGVMTVRFT